MASSSSASAAVMTASTSGSSTPCSSMSCIATRWTGSSPETKAFVKASIPMSPLVESHYRAVMRTDCSGSVVISCTREELSTDVPAEAVRSVSSISAIMKPALWLSASMSFSSSSANADGAGEAREVSNEGRVCRA